MEDEVRITVIATGFEKEPFPTAEAPQPVAAEPAPNRLRRSNPRRKSVRAKRRAIRGIAITMHSHRAACRCRRSLTAGPPRAMAMAIAMSSLPIAMAAIPASRSAVVSITTIATIISPPRRNERVYQDDGYGEDRAQPRRGFTPDVPSFLKRRDDE